MVGDERLLQRVQFAVLAFQALDGGERCAVGLDREHEAAADGLAVDQDGAGTADAVLTAEVGAGEAAVLAKRVGEGAAGSTSSRMRSPLTLKVTSIGFSLVDSGRASARRTISAVIARRKGAGMVSSVFIGR